MLELPDNVERKGQILRALVSLKAGQDLPVVIEWLEEQQKYIDTQLRREDRDSCPAVQGRAQVLEEFLDLCTDPRSALRTLEESVHRQTEGSP